MKRRDFFLFISLGMASCGTVSPKLWANSQPSNQVNNQTTNQPLPNNFSAIPAGSPLFRFVAIADTGTGTANQYAVAEAMTAYYRKNPFDFVLLAGDNIYPNGEIERVEAVFVKPYQTLLNQGIKFYACLGNHDVRTLNGINQINYRAFNMTGRYYNFTHQNLEFFALDTNDPTPWAAQFRWLERQLKQSTATNKIVFGHHHLYSSGVRGINRDLIQQLATILEKYNVPLYINGHEHHYERTQPIRGTTYLTCGATSMPRPVGQSSWTAYSTSDLSFAVLDVYPRQIMIRGVNTKNEIFDQGVINLPAKSS
jgi:3',5'-cyclic AMP phosphodiesterase CpdA